MLTDKTFKPGGLGKCQWELCSVHEGDELIIVQDSDRYGAYLVCNSTYDTVGYLSDRHWVSIDLENGREILYASVQSTAADFDGNLSYKLRVVTGDDGDTFPPSAPASVDDLVKAFVSGITITAVGPDSGSRPLGLKTYRVGIVGESYRQAAIRSCAVGDAVQLLPDPQNQYDPRAIAVLARDQQLGFLPRDGWLTDVILDQCEKVAASIDTIGAGAGGDLGVVLKVSW